MSTILMLKYFPYSKGSLITVRLRKERIPGLFLIVKPLSGYWKMIIIIVIIDLMDISLILLFQIIEVRGVFIILITINFSVI